MQQVELDMWVIKAQQGDEKALLGLFLHYQTQLIHFAYGITRDRSMAQDATQEAWLTIVKNIRGLQETKAFRSWIYRAVRWAALDQLRIAKIYANGVCEQDVETLPCNEKNRDEGLVATIKQLPHDEYQAIYLFYFAQLTLVEIALIQEVPVGTVKTRLYRGRNKLKNILENKNEC